MRMLSLNTFFVFALLLLTNTMLAQNTPGTTCGTDEMHQHALRQSTTLKQIQKNTDAIILKNIERAKYARTSAATYTIPVVVHIIHNNGAENITDAQILAGIQHMNDAFNNSGLYAQPDGVVTGIQFCLAKQDEEGNPTTGITRHQSTLTNMLAPSQDLALKNIVRWDPTQYINIWIVNEVTSESAGAGVAGYAFFPYAHGSVQDGIVCEARFFGNSVNDSKVHIHELGHYLGLYHTFEGGCVNNNCMTDGDRVCDTPPDGSSSPVPCAAPINTCTTDSDDITTNNPFRPIGMGGLGDQNDPVANYMDYGNDFCRINFTDGQTERMVAAITGLRVSLLLSAGCNDPCPNPAHLAFTPSDTTVYVGAVVQFINSTTGASAYQWQINGTTFSTATNPSYTFNQQGNYEISLTTPVADPLCKRELSIIVKVICNVNATFTGPREMNPGEQVTFTNTTTGAISYEWLINGVSAATTQHFTHTFATAGGYNISLVAYNGQCYDTSRTLFVQSASCTTGNQGNIWHFGNWAGLDFSSGTAVPVDYPVFPDVPFSLDLLYYMSDEACISMSDASGQFLFYANPNYVFNRNRIRMPNGSNLIGNFSATQMAAVQDPGNPDRYYVFTLDAFGGPDGVHYSVVNMSLDGGLGDVEIASKNTLLTAPATEKASTVKHANGVDTWLVVHEYNTNSFFSYLISATGVSATPVVSSIGSVHGGYSLGQLKFSPDGCKIAVAMWDEATVEIFNFDNQTGVLSSPISITGADYQGCYGVEFSPDGSKLYIGTELTKNVYQFDMSNNTAADLIASRVFIGHINTNTGMAAFQLGPYGKIYIARTGQHYLGLIENPNAPGLLCDFVIDGVSLGDRTSGNGLPCFSQQYFYDPTPVITGPDTVCTNSTAIKYKVSASSCATQTTTWTYIGDGTLVSFDDSLAVINFAGTGIDTLIAERVSACGTTVDTLYITIKDVFPDIPDTTFCSTPIILDGGGGYISYLWQDHSTQQTFTANAPGKYWVELTRAGGCSYTDTIHVLPSNLILDLGPDRVQCPGAITVLNAGNNHITYLWSDHSTEQTLSVYLAGKYWVTITDVCGTLTDTVNIIPSTSHLSVDLNGDKEICGGETIVLDAGTLYDYYVWQDNSTTHDYTVTKPGTYWVSVTDLSGCYASDTIRVTRGVNCCEVSMVPSLFTPNNDGENDVFEIPCVENDVWTLEVFNRWGQRVYYKVGYANTWNAEGVSDGIYYYLLKRDQTTRKGWVQVVR